jgi:hypothetical protein
MLELQSRTTMSGLKFLILKSRGKALFGEKKIKIPPSVDKQLPEYHACWE